MNQQFKFTLVPMSGTLESTGGYRAKSAQNDSDVIEFDDVIAEAREEGAFFGISNEMMKIFFRGVLQTAINKTAADGKTRKFDEFLTISMRIRGKFDAPDEDFDETKHSLALSIRQLSAFRPTIKLQAVNVNRKRQFRIYSISAADGLHKNLKVVWKQDIRIKGADLLEADGEAFVACQMKTPDGSYLSVTPQIVSATATEIVIHWPSEYNDKFYKTGSMLISVDKFGQAQDPTATLPMRQKLVYVHET